MPGPFIFIATNKLKPGAFEAERQRVPGLSDFLKAREPRLLAFNEYASEDRTEVFVVQVHPDSDSMESHIAVARVRAERAYAEMLESTAGIQVFGTPSQRILKMLRNQAGTGVPINIAPLHLGGFTRLE